MTQEAEKSPSRDLPMLQTLPMIVELLRLVFIGWLVGWLVGREQQNPALANL